MALLLPIVVLFLCGLIEIAMVGRDQLALELAAREAARAAAVSATPAAAAERAAREAITLAPLAVTTAAGAQLVTVTVRYDHDPAVPLIGELLDRLVLSAEATMAWEPP